MSYQTYFGQKKSHLQKGQMIYAVDTGQYYCAVVSRVSLGQMEKCLIVIQSPRILGISFKIKFVSSFDIFHISLYFKNLEFFLWRVKKQTNKKLFEKIHETPVFCFLYSWIGPRFVQSLLQERIV